MIAFLAISPSKLVYRYGNYPKCASGVWRQRSPSSNERVDEHGNMFQNWKHTTMFLKKCTRHILRYVFEILGLGLSTINFKIRLKPNATTCEKEQVHDWTEKSFENPVFILEKRFCVWGIKTRGLCYLTVLKLFHKHSGKRYDLGGATTQLSTFL